MLIFLDYFFLIFHTSLSLFNVLGWIWQKTRRYNLALLLLTGSSWVFLGIFYGFGYCPLTDWHWHVLHELGRHDLPASYITYLLERLTGADLPGQHVDMAVAGSFAAALALSAWLNIRDYRRTNR